MERDMEREWRKIKTKNTKVDGRMIKSMEKEFKQKTE
jgi:hypothetical protein